MLTVVQQTWEESEAGWGTRPDGVSLHKTSEDHRKFLERVGTPGTKDEYSRPVGEPTLVEISQEVYDLIENDGMWVIPCNMGKMGLRYRSGWKSE